MEVLIQICKSKNGTCCFYFIAGLFKILPISKFQYAYHIEMPLILLL